MTNMKTQLPMLTLRGSSHWKFWLLSLSFLSGLVLSVLSLLEICVERCSANEEYLFFGLPFAFIGIAFFILLIFLNILSGYYPFFLELVKWLVALAFGAEILFIIVQHYQIGRWCPLCLSIAASVGFAALVLMVDYFKNFKLAIQHHNRGDIMQEIKKGFYSLSLAFLGFLIALIGVGKFNAVEAGMNDIKNHLTFGNRNSSVEVYFVTDWFCPACKQVEEDIEKIYPEIKNKVAFYFIDYPIHKKSLNFTPYNLAFMTNNKSQYFKARQLLANLADKTENPKNQEVQDAANKNSIAWKELSFVDIKAGIEFFDQVASKYDVRATPAIVVVNPRKNKSIKFEGRDEISNKKILEAIEKMKHLKG